MIGLSLSAHGSSRRRPLSLADPLCEVVVEQDLESLLAHLAALENLAERSIEENVFYEPWMLMPALRHFETARSSRFVLIYDRRQEGANSAARPELLGFFPLQAHSHYRGLHFPHLALYRYPHCFLSSPLVDRDHVLKTVQTLFSWLKAQREFKLLRFQQIQSAGILHNCLEHVLNETHLRTASYRYERAAFFPATDAETYFSTRMSSGFRKEMRRKSRKLSQLGDLEYAVLSNQDELQPWLDDFLQLEAAGWKGTSGTALMLSARDRHFFTDVLQAAFARQRLLMLSLKVDGKPVAMQVNLLSAKGGFAFKVAYDETFSTYSPGVLLDMELIRHLHSKLPLQWLDLCTDDPVMFSRLFSGRRAIRNLTVSNGDHLANLVAHLLPLAKRLRRV